MKTGLGLAALMLGTALLAQPANAQQQEVTIWSWFISSTMLKSIAAFEAEHPDITVNYTYYNQSPEYFTALRAASAAGTLPDLIGLSPGSFMQQYREDLVRLNERAEAEWGPDWEERIFEVNRVQMLMGNPEGDDSFYMLPQLSQVLAIWYNRAIFEELGLEVPESYADMVSTAHTLTENGYIPMFQGAAAGWQNQNVFLMIANQRSPGSVEWAQAGEEDWTSPELVQSMHDWRAFFTDEVFQQGALGAQGYPVGAQLLAQGRVGMMALGSWWMQESKFPPPLSEYVENMEGFDWFHLPPLEGSDRSSPPIGGVDIGYGLTNNGADNEAAWTFLASLIDGVALQEALNDLNDLPAFYGHAPEGEITPHVREMFDRFMEDLPNAENQRIGSPEISDALDNALAGVAAGSLEPEEALARVQEVTDQVYGR